MKALYFDGKLTLRDVPPPQRAPGEALIKVLLAGICGTDREILKGYSGFHGIPGHEFVGRVVECDDARWIAQRVVGEINLACGRCSWCAKGLGRHCPTRSVLGIVNRPGVFAEYVTVPVENLHRVPDEISDVAATFTEPVAAACEILDARAASASRRRRRPRMSPPPSPGRLRDKLARPEPSMIRSSGRPARGARLNATRRLAPPPTHNRRSPGTDKARRPRMLEGRQAPRSSCAASPRAPAFRTISSRARTASRSPRNSAP